MNRQNSIFLVLIFSMYCCTERTSSALDLLYNFEGDSGTAVTDKLTSDGAQDGQIFQNVDPADTLVSIFGSQSAFFDLPGTGVEVPPYSTIEIPQTTFGSDFSLTLAAHFRNDEDPLDFTRLFTSFGGTGAVSSERLILDYDVTGIQIPGVRAILNNTIVQTADVPAELAAISPGEYHHFAMTIEAGNVRAYFDGTEVLNGNVGTGYSNAVNIFLGEDPHDIGGSADEQFNGNIDEFLLIERALSAGDIAQLAAGTAVSSVVTPQAGERAVYYDFEGPNVTDQFTQDGAQNPILAADASFVSGPNEAIVGTGAANLNDPRSDEPQSPFSQINIGPVGDLGSEFTVSAVIHALGGGQLGGGLARILSNFAGSGSAAGRFILDFNPAADVADIGIRLILPDGTSLITPTPPAAFANQTITATFDSGDVKLYLNGSEVAATTAASTSIDLGDFDLRIGEDLGGAVNENFVGNMDDVLILSRALTPEQVAQLHQIGADALLPTLPMLDLFGDYNGDGVVNAADYTEWGDNLGGNVSLPNDMTPGTVTEDDYDVWVDNFGSTLGTASASAIPEPVSWGLMLAWLSCVCLPRKGMRIRSI